MAKLTNEYIAARIAGNAKVERAYIDQNGDAVIVAAAGFGWDCGDMPPATIDTIPASKGAKHFNLSLDQLTAIEGAPAPVAAEEVSEEAEDEFDTADGDYDAAEETEVEDDNA